MFFLSFTLLLIAQSGFACELPILRSETYHEDAKASALSWTLPHSPEVFEIPLSRPPEDEAFILWAQNSLNQHPNPSAIGRMRHHAELIRQARWMPLTEKTSSLEKIEYFIQLAPSALRKVNCLEAALHRLHNSRWPLHLKPSEFYAEVLTSPDEKTLKVFINSEDLGVVGAGPGATAEPIRQALAQGWKPFIHIHNHPFTPNNPYLDTAVLIPSDADLLTYRKKKYPRAVIIDGITALDFIPDTQPVANRP